MLENTSTNNNPSKPLKQLIVNWIVSANNMIDSNKCIVKKSFLVTGLSNALGGHEDQLIRNDLVRKEIDEVITEVFGEEAMGFKEPPVIEADSFETSDEETAESVHEPSSTSDVDHSSEPHSVYISESDEPDCSSIEAPHFELLSDSELSC